MLPAVTLALPSVAMVARMTRSSVLDVLREDYVRTARAKGVAERLVVSKHALRNAAIPILTLLGLQAGQLMGGAVLTETVFAWPGLGRLIVKAIFARDYCWCRGGAGSRALVLSTARWTRVRRLIRACRAACGWPSPRGRGTPPPRPSRHRRLGPGRVPAESPRVTGWPSCPRLIAPGRAVDRELRSAKQSLIEKRAKPGGKFLLGADEFGRDILSRVIYGSRVALIVSVLSVAVALSLGLTLGCLAGFLGGWTDVLVMRATEVLLAFPYLLLAIAVVAALGPGVFNTTLAVGIWGAPTVIRVVRGAVLVARETEYVSAARALGATALRVLTRHVLRNVLPTVIVYSTLFMANAILVEAALSFLGLGVQPPTPSWGLMVSTGRDLLLWPARGDHPGAGHPVAVLLNISETGSATRSPATEGRIGSHRRPDEIVRGFYKASAAPSAGMRERARGLGLRLRSVRA